MQHFILLITVALLFSCGQSDSKKKELELREREISLKEKELALKTKDSISRQTTTVQRQTPDAKADLHSDFNIFWADFKKAINDGDKDAVAKMTKIPFKDYYGDFVKVAGGESLTSNSEAEFKANYDKIFFPRVVKLINSNGYRGWNKSEDYTDYLGKVIGKGDYVLPQVSFPDDYVYFQGLAFSKIKGVYMLAYMPNYHNPDEGN